MPEVFSKAWNRRRTIGIIALALVILYLIGYANLCGNSLCFSSSFGQFIQSAARELAAVLLATSILGGIIIALTPAIVSSASLSVVEPREIRGLLDKAAASSTVWKFRGGLGRDFRAKTLNTLSREASKKSNAKSLLILIIDPMSQDACESYARYRAGFGDPSKWNAAFVARQLLATILSTAWIAGSNALLDVRLGLLSTWSTFRVDLSSDYAIVTRADVQDVALRYNASSAFYNAYETEMQALWSQARQLTLPAIPLDHTAEVARQLFESLGIHGAWLDADCLDEVLKYANEKSSPYGR